MNWVKKNRSDLINVGGLLLVKKKKKKSLGLQFIPLGNAAHLEDIRVVLYQM